MLLGRLSKPLGYRCNTDGSIGLAGVDAEGDDSPVGVLVVVAGYRLVLFLAGGVPDVELQAQVVHIDDFPGVADSNCHHVVLYKLAFREAH